MTSGFSHDDRIATIAACSTMGRLPQPRGREEPLGPAEWSEVARWLHERGLKPGALLEEDTRSEAFDGLQPKVASRLPDIPARASLVALELEHIENRGIWSLVRFDDGYPVRWREKLKRLAPPVVFGVGASELLNRSPGLAIVGSRDIGVEQFEVAMAIGRRFAQAGYLIISGGARGSDRGGMSGALDNEQAAVGILHGDLQRESQRRDARQWIEAKQLCLVSHVHPATGFSSGNAMARNRYIHALADATVVIATSAGTGGTWQGAVDNLKHGWSPLLVWNGAPAPAGNAALIEKGAMPFTEIPEDADACRALIDAAGDHWARLLNRSGGLQQSNLPL